MLLNDISIFIENAKSYFKPNRMLSILLNNTSLSNEYFPQVIKKPFEMSSKSLKILLKCWKEDLLKIFGVNPNSVTCLKI